MPSPNVPIAPGVPPLLRDGFGTVDVVVLLTADGVGLLGSNGGTWGVYDQGGNLVLDPDSVIDVDYKQDSQISTYPVEAGAFASYNKVATPFDFKIAMTKGGTDVDRGLFLQAVDAAVNSLDLYSVVMPDGTYPSVNLDHYDFRRTERRGVGLLTVECWFTEVRETGSATFQAANPTGLAPPTGAGFQNTTQPSAANPLSTGTVQPVVPGPETSAAAAGGFT